MTHRPEHRCCKKQGCPHYDQPPPFGEELAQILEIADRAVNRLGDTLISQGADPLTILAFEAAVEARSAVHVLAVDDQYLDNHGGSPQQAIFDDLAGPESEGMGMPAISRHLEIGIPEGD